jgi:hypothetical protein
MSIHLGVQPVAAKQYIAELVAVGILTEEGKATPLALRWRIDASYGAAVEELLTQVYPDSLRNIALPSEGDRQRAKSWFLQEGLGEGAAKNKAATYFLLGSPTPVEGPTNGAAKASSEVRPGRRQTASKPLIKSAPKFAEVRDRSDLPRSTQSPPGGIPLNVNVQIHISAEAGSEQIESIFAAMRRYLYDQ